MKNKNKIADHYGYKNQSWKLLEEVDHAIEEIADVEVVLSQIKILL